VGQPENKKEAAVVENLRVMIVAGEASSDLHAASLARSILSRFPNTELFGMGGSALREAGVRP